MALRHLRFTGLRPSVPTRHPRYRTASVRPRIAPRRLPCVSALAIRLGHARAGALISPAPSRRLAAGGRLPVATKDPRRSAERAAPLPPPPPFRQRLRAGSRLPQRSARRAAGLPLPPPRRSAQRAAGLPATAAFRHACGVSPAPRRVPPRLRRASRVFRPACRRSPKPV